MAEEVVQKAETLRDTIIDNTRVKMADTLSFKIFLAVSCAVTCAEPIVVGFGISNPAVYNLQIALLAISSALFVIGIALTFIVAAKDPEAQDIHNFSLLGALFDGEVFLELCLLIFGWATIFNDPGLSVLRCFRVFRLMWYLELYPAKFEKDYDPAEHFFSLRRACQLCLLYLERLGSETVSAASRGAVVVLALFFYCSYLVAVMFWYDERNLNTPEGYSCGTLNNCFIVMLRLAFYDGTGFDFMQTTMNSGAHGYTFVLFLYLIASAIILLNGLIGIFGNAFSTPEEVEKEPEEEDEKLLCGGDGNNANNNKKVIPAGNDRTDFDDSLAQSKQAVAAQMVTALEFQMAQLQSDLAALKALLANDGSRRV